MTYTELKNCSFCDHRLVKAGCDRKVVNTISLPLWPAHELPQHVHKILQQSKFTLSCIWLLLPHSKQAVIRFEKHESQPLGCQHHAPVMAFHVHYQWIHASSLQWCAQSWWYNKATITYMADEEKGYAALDKSRCLESGLFGKTRQQGAYYIIHLTTHVFQTGQIINRNSVILWQHSESLQTAIVYTNTCL